MIPPGRSYEQAQAEFRWPRPARFNIAQAVCDRHPAAALGMIVENADSSVRTWTFGELARASARLANALKARGVAKGDRVGVFLSQSAELAIGHLACYRMGAIALPLFTLFGEEAVEYRAANAGACALLTDMSQLPKVLAVRERLPELRPVDLRKCYVHWRAAQRSRESRQRGSGRHGLHPDTADVTRNVSPPRQISAIRNWTKRDRRGRQATMSPECGKRLEHAVRRRVVGLTD